MVVLRKHRHSGGRPLSVGQGLEPTDHIYPADSGCRAVHKQEGKLSPAAARPISFDNLHEPEQDFDHSSSRQYRCTGSLSDRHSHRKIDIFSIIARSPARAPLSSVGLASWLDRMAIWPISLAAFPPPLPLFSSLLLSYRFGSRRATPLGL